MAINKHRGRPKGISGRVSAMRDLAISLREKGGSYIDIARILNVSKQRVGQLFAVGLNNNSPGICCRCKNHCHKLHRHHTDYRANKIEWICVGCHSKIHNKGKSSTRITGVFKQPKPKNTYERRDKMILGELLMAWRKEYKFSRRKLAHIIGIDHVTLSRIENGDSGSVSFENLGKIVAWIFKS